jgi:hypothetical protein
MIDNLILVDNSKDDGELVLEINNEVITFEATVLPEWVAPVITQFKL